MRPNIAVATASLLAASFFAAGHDAARPPSASVDEQPSIQHWILPTRSHPVLSQLRHGPPLNARRSTAIRH